jgi:hypothetical protein
MFALTEAPAIDGQRDQPLFHADGRVSRLHAGSAQQLLLAQVVLAGVPVDEKQSGSGVLATVGNEQQRGHWLDSIKVEDPALERVAVVLFSAHKLWRGGLMVPGQIAKQRPQLAAALFLIGGEVGG